MVYNASPVPCDNSSYGEIEDYNINITEAPIDPPSDYCTVSSTYPESGAIENVSFGSINKSSSYSTSYSDFTAEEVNLSIGSSETLTVTPPYSYGYSTITAWIDWNQDGDFEDANEVVLSEKGKGAWSGTITAPANALTGQTRLRIRCGYWDYPTSCGDNYYGETEDYTVNVLSGTTKENTISDNRLNDLLNDQLRLYPNPNKGVFVVETILDNEDKVQLFIHDMVGRIVYKKEINDNNKNLRKEISVNGLKGVYRVVLRQGSFQKSGLIIFE